MNFQYWDWQEVDINWELLNLNWEEVGILIEDVLPAVGTGPGGGLIYDTSTLNKLSDEKKRKIIKIVCKINGEEYEESKYKNEKDIKITYNHIDSIVNEILNNIKVDVQNIS